MDRSTEGPSQEERELVSRARAGDVRAYEELVRAHSGIAQRTAFLITRSQAEAEDAAQVGFVKAYTSLGRFDPDRPFRPWLLRIVGNEARNRRRSAGRRARLELAASSQEPRVAPSPELDVVTAERRRELLDAVESLRESDREVIGLRYFLELGEAEMAGVLGVAAGTVKSRLARAMGRLRTKLEERGVTLDV
ncbi:MAG: RNA polymerase sigma factor [Actinomycetota bacterium]